MKEEACGEDKGGGETADGRQRHHPEGTQLRHCLPRQQISISMWEAMLRALFCGLDESVVSQSGATPHPRNSLDCDFRGLQPGSPRKEKRVMGESQSPMHLKDNNRNFIVIPLLLLQPPLYVVMK
eukprot:CAMPEP_0196758794 /NCGR_PEP_ID=MMETSP1091-20130531/104370_1 /TAXON_ID=302021 /ORGANISM="Rhodomonas sp., Strain CCMP768" /LENGTH=124 /DNA_ID=CAMNT_0042107627 /DNA_START=695 /DNA_END=1066 /DNA_ORIENTATION=-